MENQLVNSFPIDPMILIIGFSVLSLALLIVVIICIVKMNKLYRRYDLFMRGRDAESLEDTLRGILDELDELHGKDKTSKDAMRTLSKQVKNSFQKFGFVKYNAFRGMGGNLSFALAMLDSNNTGFVLDVVHSQEGCYLYLKEVEEGATEVLLGNEEKEALEQALGYIKRTPISEKTEGRKRRHEKESTSSKVQDIEIPNSERNKSERLKALRRRKNEEKMEENSLDIAELDRETADEFRDDFERESDDYRGEY